MLNSNTETSIVPGQTTLTCGLKI